MSQEYEQKGPMEGHGTQPEEFVFSVCQLGPFPQFGFCVAEKRTEKQDFQQHPANGTCSGAGIIKTICLDPRQGFLLAARGWDSERYRRKSPPNNAIGHADEENGDRKIGYHNAEKSIQSGG